LTPDSATSTFNNPIPLPSLETADAIDKQQEEAYAALEFSSYEENQYVKCQCCNNWIKRAGKMHKPTNDRIEQIRRRIKQIEAYNLKYNKGSSDNGIKELKQELAELLKDEEKRDKLRNLPLYSSRSTNYLFYCSICWETAYRIYEQERKKQKA
jgi:hypothetical protein